MTKIIFPKIDLDNVKGVLIDIDNTLYHYDSCHKKAIKKCYKKFSREIGKKLSFEEFNLKYRSYRTLITKRLCSTGACRSRLFAFQEMFEELGVGQSWVLALDYRNLYWDSIINCMILVPEAKEFLQKCKDANIKVCVVSDMLVTTQIRKLKKLGLKDYVDYLVTSEEVGFEKPNKEIFELALKKIDLDVNEVIMVGDSEKKDIKGAKIMGIKSWKVEILEE